MASFRAWGILLVGVLSFAAGCTREPAIERREFLVWRMPREPSSLDPARASGSRTQAVVRRTHEGLLRPDPVSGAPTPGLAESWEISADGRQYVFHLREGVVFHDGSPLTAADVVFSLARHFDPEVQSSLVPFLLSVSGGVDRLEGHAEQVSGLQAVDEHTVRLELSAPFAPLLSVLSMAQAGVVPAGSQPQSDSGGALPGTGPFLQGVWQRGRHLELVAFPGYWGGAPRLPGVRFLFVEDEGTALAQFRAGEIGVLDGLPAGQRQVVAREEGDRLQTVNGLSIYALGVNHAKEPLGSNALLRRALAHAVDRRFICDVLNEGKDRPADQLLPPEMMGHNPNIPGFPFDLEETARFLLQAGFPGGRGLPVLRVLYNPTDPVAARLLERLQADLAEVGVVLEPEAMEYAALSELMRRGGEAMAAYDLFRLTWDADYPDPDALFTPLLDSASIGGGANVAYRDETLDLLLAQGRRETDPASRASLYRAASHRVAETVALIPIYWKGDDMLVQPRVEGLVLGLLGESAVALDQVRLGPAVD